MPCVASYIDAVSGVKKLAIFVPVINCPTSAFEPSFYFETLQIPNTAPKLKEFFHEIGDQNHRKFTSNEGLNAEVGQVIAGIKFVSFLTSDMASGYPSTE